MESDKNVSLDYSRDISHSWNSGIARNEGEREDEDREEACPAPDSPSVPLTHSFRCLVCIFLSALFPYYPRIIRSLNQRKIEASVWKRKRRAEVSGESKSKH